MKQPQFSAIILSGGHGARFGDKTPKQYSYIDDETVLKKAVRPFVEHSHINKVVVVIKPGDETLCQQALGELYTMVEIAYCGPTRQSSTRNGLIALEKWQPDYVYIHDGARPFISKQNLDALAQEVSSENGALLAAPISDTIKRADKQAWVVNTVDRDNLFAAQTPQLFPFQTIITAHKSAESQHLSPFTDDCAIAEWYHLPMKLVQNPSANLKITWPDDLERARKMTRSPLEDKIMPDIRVGSGYDVHAFVEGDQITLCGIKIPFHHGLNGHSDSDVALHALTDALLATCGEGDIGSHFPPSDPRWKGADSAIFLRHAIALIKKHKGRISNIDITLIAEEPKIGPHRDKMVENLMDLTELPRQRISVKATTNERIGFVGRKEGIAALASTLVMFSSD